MSERPASVTEAAYIPAPRDADLQALLDYWNKKRGARAMPSRTDIDPIDIPALLPHLMMCNVGGPGGPHKIRLVGEEIVAFVGRNFTGMPAASCMEPNAAAMVVEILDTVAAARAPRFRAGKAYWRRDKSYRDYEACFLPLSADGTAVNIILAGIKFSD